MDGIIGFFLFNYFFYLLVLNKSQYQIEYYKIIIYLPEQPFFLVAK